MMNAFFGSIGIGLVWGWLLAKRPPQKPLSLFSLLILSIPTTGFAFLVKWFGDWQHVAAFLAAQLLGILLHHLWLKQLDKKFNQIS